MKNHRPLGGRVLIVGVEFLAIILFCRDAAKWIRGMDELQRRITLELFLF